MIRTVLQNVELFGEIALPTSEGGTLRFSEAEGWIHGELQVEVSHRDTESEMPTDVLQTTLFVADATGALWSAWTATTAGFLVEKMEDLAFAESVLCPHEDADEERKALFDQDFLGGCPLLVG